MKSFTANSTQPELLNADELGGKTINVYKTLCKRLRTEGSETPRIPGYREENLLDENMGPEIRRMRW